MRRIPKVHTNDRLINQLQQNFAQALEPLLSNPITQGVLLTSVKLTSGANQVQHGLGRAPQGWIPVRVRGSATLYDEQDTNSTPSLTLSLVTSADVTVDLYVF